MPNHNLAQQIVLRQRQVRLEMLRAQDKRTDQWIFGTLTVAACIALLIYYF